MGTVNLIANLCNYKHCKNEAVYGQAVISRKSIVPKYCAKHKRCDIISRNRSKYINNDTHSTAGLEKAKAILLGMLLGSLPMVLVMLGY